VVVSRSCAFQSWLVFTKVDHVSYSTKKAKDRFQDKKLQLFITISDSFIHY